VLYQRKGPRCWRTRGKEERIGKEGGEEANERFLLVTSDRPVCDCSVSDVQSGTII
jgi:hypothetical protein